MHMLHMHISIDIIITLSFFITDFLLSSVLNGVSALDGGIVTLFAGFVNPLFYIPAICKKIRQQSPTVFVCFAARIILSYPPKHSLLCCAFAQKAWKSVIASQCSHWRGNPFLLLRHGVTDSHTSDFGHWFGMTETGFSKAQKEPSGDARWLF